MDPAELPLGRMVLDLLHGDDVPDAGAPVGEQTEAEHHQGEDDETVLGVLVHLLDEPEQSQQSYQFEQIQPGLWGGWGSWGGRQFESVERPTGLIGKQVAGSVLTLL